MAAPSTQMTTQQIKDKQANSPEWQNTQQTRQQWQAIFQNEQLCAAYLWNDKYIPVPEDTQTREYAIEAAQQVQQQRMSALTDKANPGEFSPGFKNDVFIKATTKFLRKCSAYFKDYTKTSNKQAKQLMKQNPGSGAYTQAQLIPRDPDNKAEVRQAAINAGVKAAVLDKQGDQKSLDVLQQQISGQLSNKMYSTYFLYTYYCNMAGEDPNDPTQIGTKRGFQDQTQENKRIQTLNQLSKAYANYENSFRPTGEPDKKAIDKYDQQKQVDFNGGQLWR